MSEASVSIGISIGSVSCAVAIVSTAERDVDGVVTRELRPNIIAAEDGERTTPAFASYGGGELLVGATAKNAYIRHPLRTVSCLPALVGDVKAFIEGGIVTAEVAKSDDGEVIVPTADEDGGPHPVSELLTALLVNIKGLVVDAAGGKSINSIVVSVPRYVNPQPVRTAVEDAQLPGNNLAVIHDDCAAALANGISGVEWPSASKAEGVLVIDWGANAATVSVLDVSGGAMCLVASDFSTAIGGRTIDAALVKMLIQNFKRKTKMDPGTDGRPIRKLTSSAEKAKITLSSSQTASLEVEAFFEGMDLMDNLSRGKLDQVLGELQLMAKAEVLIGSVIQTSKGTKITHVVLSGGTLKIPSLSNSLKSRLPAMVAGSPGLVILDSVPGDEAAAIGAAIQAAISGSEQPSTELRRRALAYDLCAYSSPSAPSADAPLPEDGLIVLAKKGAPLPLSLHLKLAEGSGRSLLLVGRVEGEEVSIVPLGDSFEIGADAKEITLQARGDGSVVVSEGTKDIFECSPF